MLPGPFAAPPTTPSPTSAGTSGSVWSWPAQAPWSKRREALALALVVQPRAAHVRAFVDSIPPDDWPRWTEDEDRTMQDGLRLPPVLRPLVLISPHNLVGRLIGHAGWDDPRAQPDLLAVLDRLVAEGEPVNRLVAEHETRTTEWRSPLQWAALNNRPVLVDRLLDLGADPAATAWQTSQIGPRRLPMNALTCAAGFGSLGMVRRLLDTGMPLTVAVRTVGIGNKTHPTAYSALHAAVRRKPSSDADLNESRAILTALVQAGMPLNLDAGGPMSAVHQTVEDGHPALLAHLLTLGGDIDRPHYGGLSAWDEALALERHWKNQTPSSEAGDHEKARAAAVMGVLRAHRVACERRVLNAEVPIPDEALRQASGHGATSVPVGAGLRRRL